jgi:hypothetical protein
MAQKYGVMKTNVIETLHLEFYKYVMRAKKTTPNCIVCGELGRMPMSILVKARMIGFWEHILNGKKEKISHTLYEILYKLQIGNVYHSKWLLCIKDRFI